MFKNSIVLVAGLSLLVGCGKESPSPFETELKSRGVFQGIDATNPSVGFITAGFSNAANPPVPSNICTATVIKNRCILTAAHCSVPTHFIRTNDYYSDNNRQFFQVLRGEKRIQISSDTATEAQTSKDLAIYWLAPKGAKGNFQSTPLVPVSAWSPASLALGTFPTAANILGILGFGKFNDSSTLSANLIKRFGGMAFSSAINMSGAGNGGLIRLNRQAPTYRGFCKGDSGGPLMALGTLYGVGSTGPAQCSNTSGGARFTSLTNGNNTWITQKMNTDICIPKLSVIAVNGPGGKVTGTRANQQVINCGGTGSTDASCLSNLDPRTVVLSAVANSGWHFDKWQSFSGMPGSCPCANSTNPSCTVNPLTFNLPSMGNSFIESANCTASFARNQTMPTPAP